MTGIPDRYTLFVSDLFLYHGGVSDYTDHFAQELFRKGRLESVITPFPTDTVRDYRVTVFKINPERKPGFSDRWKMGSKMRTLYFYGRLYVTAYRSLKKLNLKKNDCLIFTEYYTFPFDIIVYCARQLKIRYAIVFHGLDLLCAKNERFTHFLENFKKAEFVIYNSEATRLLARKLFPLKQEPELILYPGIDVKALNNQTPQAGGFQKIARNPGEFIFATVSRLVKRKGIDIAIKIVSELVKARIPVRYYIGGTGEEELKLKALAKELGAENSIYFLGEITHESKYALLKASDFFLLPNHSALNSDFEGFGISCIEASFFGNVVIAGNHGGVKEAVLDGKTGFLFDFDKPESLSQAIMMIRNCIDNPELRNQIVKNGTEYVRSTYDWNKLIDHFIEFEQAVYAA